MIPQLEVSHEVSVAAAGAEEDERVLVLEVVEVLEPDVQQRLQPGPGRDREHATGCSQSPTRQT